MKRILAVLLVFLLPMLAFAQDAVPTEEFLKALIASIGGMKGASHLAIAGVVVQLLIMLLKTPLMGSVFKKIGGQWKLTVVSGLSLIAGVISLKLSGVELGAALIHSTTLTAFMVFANELYKHFAKPAEPKLELPPNV